MTGAVFSRGEGLVFGSFHYPLGLVEFTYTDDVADILSNLGSGTPVAGDRDESELVELAYQTASMMHEMRHFFDQFGTFSGICLIMGYLDCLKRFANAVARIRRDGTLWRWPVSAWVRADDCPQEVRDFYRRTLAFRRGADAFVSPFKPIEVEGHLEELFVDVPYVEGHSIAAAVVRVLRLYGSEQSPRTLLHPIGLEALFESNAHALSRSLIDTHFPAHVSEAFQQRIWTIDHGDGENMADGAMPYMIVDLAISRFMRDHGVPEFERNLVLGLADSALSESPFILREVGPRTTAAEVVSPGESLRESLREEDVAAFKDGVVEVPQRQTDGYAQLLERFEKRGDWDKVADDNSLMASLLIWESYLTRHVTVPLLRARLSTDHRAYRTANGMSDLLAAARPPVIVMGKELRTNDLPDRVQQAWWHQMMVGQIAMRIVDDEPLLCPRAWAIVPGLESVSLTRPGEPGCDDYALLGCGSFRGGRQMIRPPCLFQDVLQGCGFIA